MRDNLHNPWPLDHHNAGSSTTTEGITCLRVSVFFSELPQRKKVRKKFWGGCEGPRSKPGIRQMDAGGDL